MKGFFEKTFAPLGLRKIQDEVLANLKKEVETTFARHRPSVPGFLPVDCSDSVDGYRNRHVGTAVIGDAMRSDAEEMLDAITDRAALKLDREGKIVRLVPRALFGLLGRGSPLSTW